MFPTIGHVSDGLHIASNGDKRWFKDNNLHREDGPAYERISKYGHKWSTWYKNGLRHREDGPAVERDGDPIAWFYNGAKIECSSTEEFIRLIKLKVFW